MTAYKAPQLIGNINVTENRHFKSHKQIHAQKRCVSIRMQTLISVVSRILISANGNKS